MQRCWLAGRPGTCFLPTERHKINFCMNDCSFCSRTPADPNFTVSLPLYRLRRYTHLGVVRRFEYDKLVVALGRCAGCAHIHGSVKRRRKTFTAVGAAVGFLIGVVIPGGFLFTTIIGGVIGNAVSMGGSKKMCERLRVKSLHKSVLKTVPPVDTYVASGWRLEKR